MLRGGKTEAGNRPVPYHFTECGLPGVWLSGIRYFECPSCGAQSAEIPAVSQLLALIARALVEKESKLTGAEIRFLRKRLGKKAVEAGLQLWESRRRPSLNTRTTNSKYQIPSMDWSGRCTRLGRQTGSC